jgi:Fur family peroxide stress response transcriptional regulator
MRSSIDTHKLNSQFTHPIIGKTGPNSFQQARTIIRIIPSIDTDTTGTYLGRLMSGLGNSPEHLNERLTHSGFRFTPHRQHVYGVLLQHRDHPTAEEVFIRAKTEVPDISMATVYNCLDALVKSGLVRLVNVDRGATKYCPNMEEHGHFVCEVCGSVFDVDLRSNGGKPEFQLPEGFKVKHYDIAIHGECASCTPKG